MKYFSRFILLALLSFAVLFSTAAGQRRDFVTEQEGEVIREAQEIDLRVEALTKFIDRRLAAANIARHTWTPPKKNSELWGPEPAGSRSELLSDIRRLLQKSIDDIDDIASRTSTAIEGNEVGGKLFPKAMRNLAAAATRYKPIFQGELEKSSSNTDRGLLIQSIEFCDQIIEASAKVAAEEPKKKKT
ncbi:MAG: hypothetical protein PSX80_09915 [bacterium]|nr:hypothetical protein [bacterium]